MTAKSDYLTRVFSGYLDRRSVPQHLHGKDAAQADEFSALIRSVVKCAPESNYQEWWPRMEDAIDSIMRTRVWPTVNEIRGAARLVTKNAPEKKASSDWEANPVAINARRIRAGEPVADAWCYGRCAVDLLLSGQITEGDLAPYRSGMFFKERDVIGEETARTREKSRRARHDAALEAVGMPPMFNGYEIAEGMIQE